MQKTIWASLIWLFALAMVRCSPDGQDASDLQTYDGPVSEVTDTEILYSDSAKVRVRVTGKKQLDFENGNQEFPEGFFIEFYDEKEVKTSTIKANQGQYNQKEKLYTATGEVIVVNIEDGEKLETELLNWSPNEHEIFTDRYVEITTGDEILMGKGLTADENFEAYRILKPTGSFTINN